MNVGLLKTSLVNFPGRVCAAVFLPGCNLRCPYCHNAELAQASIVTGPIVSNADDEHSDYVDISEVYTHLEKRSRVLGGLAISGGEPLLSPALNDLIKKAKSLNLEVKIDTNGTLPERLKTILNDPELRPTMIAIDVKTSPEKYGLLAIEEQAGIAQGKALKESLHILKKDYEVFAGTKNELKVEYRTVLVPGIVDETDIRTIASLLPKTAVWRLANFVPGHCLDQDYDSLDPFSPTRLETLVHLAQSLIPDTELR